MKAVICCINSKYIHSSLAPWCLLAGVEAYADKDISATVLEGTINENPKAIADRIVDAKPDVLSFCTYIWNINTVYTVLNMVKETMPNLCVIFGGPEVSYNTKEVLEQHPEVTYILSGEGERSYPALLTAMLHHETVENIEGISYRENGNIIVTPPCVLEEDPISPYTDAYFQALNGRIAYLETSRGCPYTCAFCLSGRCGKARFFDIERAKKDIIRLAQSGTQTLKLVDRTFNANKKRAKELFQFVIDNHGTNIPSDVCVHFEIAGDILDDETIDILSQAPIGSIQLEIGLQSFNATTLTAIRRKTNVERLKQNIQKLLRVNNMHIHIDLIAGLPYEDLESFKESFNIAYDLQPNMLQLGFLKLLHGAPMREEVENFPCSYCKEPPYEVIDTPWITEKELQSLHGVEDALERLYNSGRFRKTLAYMRAITKEKPYAFFESFAHYLGDTSVHNVPLDTYLESFYNFCKIQEGVDEQALRDALVCDRLAVNASGTLPQCLRVQDKNYKKIRNAVNTLYPVPKEKCRKRGFAVLYTKEQAVFTDYTDYNRVTGAYALQFVPLSALEEIIANMK